LFRSEQLSDTSSISELELKNICQHIKFNWEKTVRGVSKVSERRIGLCFKYIPNSHVANEIKKSPRPSWII
jgi:hypothetical protein